MTKQVTDLTVLQETTGSRIDKFINDSLEDVSRTEVQKLIKDQHVTVNGLPVKQNYKVSLGDTVQVIIPEPVPLEISAESIPLDIRFEDSDLLVINKPRGMVVHPAPGHYTGTLVNALLAYCKDLSGINGVLRPGIVHRLDKDTSGLIMVAKNDKAHRELAEQIKQKSAKRQYKAMVHGVIGIEEGTVEAPIGRDPKHRKKMAVIRQNSKEACTHFTVEERFQKHTLVHCRLETGRTHQIRVHMAYIGHPVAADPKYGPKKSLNLDGQALHASKLTFSHPMTGDKIAVTAELPKDMRELIKNLRIDR